MNRRETLAMLGLAPASTAVGAESFIEPVNAARRNSLPRWTNKQAADTFRRFADALDRGEVSVFSLNVGGTLRFDDVLKHQLTVEFSYKPHLKVSDHQR